MAIGTGTWPTCTTASARSHGIGLVAGACDPHIVALRDLADALGHEGIDWAVAGAVAANVHREVIRTTNDLDVMIALAGQDLTVVQNALHERGWTTFAVAGDFLLRLGHPEAGRLDVMVSGTDYETGAIGRAHRVEHDEGLSFKTLAVEDVVILKLIADRSQDAADVESILATKPDFDKEYMTRWFEVFEHLDLSGRYERCLTNVQNQGLLQPHRL